MVADSVEVPSVAVIADNAATIAGLRGYFQSRGLTSRATRSLLDARVMRPATFAVVLFPDEFAVKQVVQHICALRARRPLLLIIVVTNFPQRLQPAMQPDGRSLLPVVLAKPPFCWSIVDAIRQYLDLRRMHDAR